MKKLYEIVTKMKTLLVGGDRQDFDLEIEVVPVEIKTSRRDRFINAVWTMITTILAVTIATVLIIPMFV